MNSRAACAVGKSCGGAREAAGARGPRREANENESAPARRLRRDHTRDTGQDSRGLVRTTKPWRQTPFPSFTSWTCRWGTPTWTDRVMAAPSTDPSRRNPPRRMVDVSPPISHPSTLSAPARGFPRSHSLSWRPRGYLSRLRLRLRLRPRLRLRLCRRALSRSRSLTSRSRSRLRLRLRWCRGASQALSRLRWSRSLSPSRPRSRSLSLEGRLCKRERGVRKQRQQGRRNTGAGCHRARGRRTHPSHPRERSSRCGDREERRVLFWENERSPGKEDDKCSVSAHEVRFGSC